MNSRNRVIIALNHKEPDKMPIDFGGTPGTGISVIAYNNLKRYLNLSGQKAKLYDLMQQIVEPEEEVLKMIEADIVLLYREAPRFNLSLSKWKTWTLKDSSQCLVSEDYNPIVNNNGDMNIIENNVIVAKMTKEGLYYDLVYYPLAQIEESEEVDKLQFPTISDKELAYLKTRATELYENTEYAIVGAFGGSFIEFGLRCFGYEKFLMDLVMNQTMLRRWFDRLAESYLLNLEKYLHSVGKYIQVIQFSDDMGTQNSLMFSKSLYREIVKPYHKMLYQYVKSHYPHIKILLHSCGAIYELIPDLIEVGVDALNPIQISATGMDPVKLKKEFGKDLTFWGGGANMQYTVNNGTIGDIHREVERLVKIFKPGGGFIFAPVHNVQANVSPERIMAIYNTAKTCRNYNK